MGTWGFGIFDDDTAADVRDGYTGLLESGRDGPAATAQLERDWAEALRDSDEGPVFWVALALTQHKLGRLEERVRGEALRVIERGQGLDRWRDDPRLLKRRQTALSKAREALLAPQPPPKRIALPFRDTCSWKPGEVVSYRLKSGGFAALRVLGIDRHDKGESPVCELLDWTGAAPPTAAQLRGCGPRRGELPPEALLRILSSAYPEAASSPIGAVQLMLADAGLSRRPVFNVLGFDPELAGAMTETIAALQSGDRTARRKLESFARARSPKLLEPVTQCSIRREFKASELQARRVKKLSFQLPPGELGDWIVLRWHELDEALANVFGVS